MSHTISLPIGKHLKEILNNLPKNISANPKITGVITKDGRLLQSGLIKNKIQDDFKSLNVNNAVIDDIADSVICEDKVYILSRKGSVFAYNHKSTTKCVQFEEIYIPKLCSGKDNNAVAIRGGRAHILILTNSGKIFGAGDNSKYQLVPQGKRYYESAVQLIVTDYLTHNNDSCDNFSGTVKLVNGPTRPELDTNCDDCLSECASKFFTGTVSSISATFVITGFFVGDPELTTLTLPITLDFNYFGSCCCPDEDGQLGGHITFTLISATIAQGTYPNAFSVDGFISTLSVLSPINVLSLIVPDAQKTFPLNFFTCNTLQQLSLSYQLIPNINNFVTFRNFGSNLGITIAGTTSQVTLVNGPLTISAGTPIVTTTTLNVNFQSILGTQIILPCCPVVTSNCAIIPVGTTITETVYDNLSTVIYSDGESTYQTSITLPIVLTIGVTGYCCTDPNGVLSGNVLLTVTGAVIPPGTYAGTGFGVSYNVTIPSAINMLSLILNTNTDGIDLDSLTCIDVPLYELNLFINNSVFYTIRNSGNGLSVTIPGNVAVIITPTTGSISVGTTLLSTIFNPTVSSISLNPLVYIGCCAPPAPPCTPVAFAPLQVTVIEIMALLNVNINGVASSLTLPVTVTTTLTGNCCLSSDGLLYGTVTSTIISAVVLQSNAPFIAGGTTQSLVYDYTILGDIDLTSVINPGSLSTTFSINNIQCGSELQRLQFFLNNDLITYADTASDITISVSGNTPITISIVNTLGITPIQLIPDSPVQIVPQLAYEIISNVLPCCDPGTCTPVSSDSYLTESTILPLINVTVGGNPTIINLPVNIQFELSYYCCVDTNGVLTGNVTLTIVGASIPTGIVGAVTISGTSLNLTYLLSTNRIVIVPLDGLTCTSPELNVVYDLDLFPGNFIFIPSLNTVTIVNSHNNDQSIQVSTTGLVGAQNTTFGPIPEFTLILGQTINCCPPVCVPVEFEPLIINEIGGLTLINVTYTGIPSQIVFDVYITAIVSGACCLANGMLSGSITVVVTSAIFNYDGSQVPRSGAGTELVSPFQTFSATTDDPMYYIDITNTITSTPQTIALNGLTCGDQNLTNFTFPVNFDDSGLIVSNFGPGNILFTYGFQRIQFVDQLAVSSPILTLNPIVLDLANGIQCCLCTPIAMEPQTITIDTVLNISNFLYYPNGMTPIDANISLPVIITAQLTGACCSQAGVLQGSVTITITSILVNAGTYYQPAIFPYPLTVTSNLELISVTNPTTLTTVLSLNGKTCSDLTPVIFLFPSILSADITTAQNGSNAISILLNNVLTTIFEVVSPSQLSVTGPPIFSFERVGILNIYRQIGCCEFTPCIVPNPTSGVFTSTGINIDIFNLIYNNNVNYATIPLIGTASGTYETACCVNSDGTLNGFITFNITSLVVPQGQYQGFTSNLIFDVTLDTSIDFVSVLLTPTVTINFDNLATCGELNYNNPVISLNQSLITLTNVSTNDIAMTVNGTTSHIILTNGTDTLLTSYLSYVNLLNLINRTYATSLITCCHQTPCIPQSFNVVYPIMTNIILTGINNDGVPSQINFTVPAIISFVGSCCNNSDGNTLTGSVTSTITSLTIPQGTYTNAGSYILLPNNTFDVVVSGNDINLLPLLNTSPTITTNLNGMICNIPITFNLSITNPLFTDLQTTPDSFSLTINSVVSTISNPTQSLVLATPALTINSNALSLNVAHYIPCCISECDPQPFTNIPITTNSTIEFTGVGYNGGTVNLTLPVIITSLAQGTCCVNSQNGSLSSEMTITLESVIIPASSQILYDAISGNPNVGLVSTANLNITSAITNPFAITTGIPNGIINYICGMSMIENINLISNSLVYNFTTDANSNLSINVGASTTSIITIGGPALTPGRITVNPISTNIDLIASIPCCHCDPQDIGTISYTLSDVEFDVSPINYTPNTTPPTTSQAYLKLLGNATVTITGSCCQNSNGMLFGNVQFTITNLNIPAGTYQGFTSSGIQFNATLANSLVFTDQMTFSLDLDYQTCAVFSNVLTQLTTLSENVINFNATSIAIVTGTTQNQITTDPSIILQKEINSVVSVPSFSVPIPNDVLPCCPIIPLCNPVPFNQTINTTSDVQMTGLNVNGIDGGSMILPAIVTGLAVGSCCLNSDGTLNGYVTFIVSDVIIVANQYNGALSNGGNVIVNGNLVFEGADLLETVYTINFDNGVTCDNIPDIFGNNLINQQSVTYANATPGINISTTSVSNVNFSSTVPIILSLDTVQQTTFLDIFPQSYITSLIPCCVTNCLPLPITPSVKTASGLPFVITGLLYNGLGAVINIPNMFNVSYGITGSCCLQNGILYGTLQLNVIQLENAQSGIIVGVGTASPPITTFDVNISNEMNYSQAISPNPIILSLNGLSCSNLSSVIFPISITPTFSSPDGNSLLITAGTNTQTITASGSTTFSSTNQTAFNPLSINGSSYVTCCAPCTPVPFTTFTTTMNPSLNIQDILNGSIQGYIELVNIVAVVTVSGTCCQSPSGVLYGSITLTVTEFAIDTSQTSAVYIAGSNTYPLSITNTTNPFDFSSFLSPTSITMTLDNGFCSDTALIAYVPINISGVTISSSSSNAITITGGSNTVNLTIGDDIILSTGSSTAFTNTILTLLPSVYVPCCSCNPVPFSYVKTLTTEVVIQNLLFAFASTPIPLQVFLPLTAQITYSGSCCQTNGLLQGSLTATITSLTLPTQTDILAYDSLLVNQFFLSNNMEIDFTSFLTNNSSTISLDGLTCDSLNTNPITLAYGLTSPTLAVITNGISLTIGAFSTNLLITNMTGVFSNTANASFTVNNININNISALVPCCLNNQCLNLMTTTTPLPGLTNLAINYLVYNGEAGAQVTIPVNMTGTITSVCCLNDLGILTGQLSIQITSIETILSTTPLPYGNINGSQFDVVVAQNVDLIGALNINPYVINLDGLTCNDVQEMLNVTSLLSAPLFTEIAFVNTNTGFNLETSSGSVILSISASNPVTTLTTTSLTILGSTVVIPNRVLIGAVGCCNQNNSRKMAPKIHSLLTKKLTNEGCKSCHTKSKTLVKMTNVKIVTATKTIGAVKSGCKSCRTTRPVEVKPNCKTCRKAVIVNDHFHHEMRHSDVYQNHHHKDVILNVVKTHTQITPNFTKPGCQSCQTNITPLSNACGCVETMQDSCACTPRRKKKVQECEIEFPQPCWKIIRAGDDISVFVDDNNRLWALGSLYEIRSNRRLIENQELINILSTGDNVVSFNAQVVDKLARKSCEPEFRNKFSFDDFKVKLDVGHGGTCDVMKAIRDVNEAPWCDNTCTPCHNEVKIYVNRSDNCHDLKPTSITIYNRKSVCLNLNVGATKMKNFMMYEDMNLDFSPHSYCLDGTNICLDDVIIINIEQPCQGCEVVNVNLYIDIDVPGGLKFTFVRPKAFSVDFTNVSDGLVQTVLNMGPIMDPTVLTNLKTVFTTNYANYCKEFTNPAPFRLINNYLRAGDIVRLLARRMGTFVEAVTPDLPTVFNMRKQVLDIAIGHNNLSVLVGNVNCEPDIVALGNNCHGQLGLRNNVTTTVWKCVNRCYFECPVVKIFPGPKSTFYLTNDWSIYSTGDYKNLNHSNIPQRLNVIKRHWQTRKLIATENQIIVLGDNGKIYGFGPNDMGQLGSDANYDPCRFRRLHIKEETLCEEWCCDGDPCRHEGCVSKESRRIEYVPVREERHENGRRKYEWSSVIPDWDNSVAVRSEFRRKYGWDNGKNFEWGVARNKRE